MAEIQATTPFPVYPNLPPYDNNDPTSGIDLNNAQNFGGTGYMQVLMNEITELDAHPASAGDYLNLIKTIAYLSQAGVLTNSDIHFLNDKCNLGNLLKDGMDYAAQFSFMYGYGGNGGGTILAYTGFANAVLGMNLPSNALTDAITAEARSIVDPSNVDHFFKEHLANSSDAESTDAYGNPVHVGDMIWKFQEVDSNGNPIQVIYDFTTANAAYQANAGDPWVTGTLQTITDMIQNSSVAGNPNPDVDTLDQALQGMQTEMALETFDMVFKETKDVGMAILAFIYTIQGYQMNRFLSGPADVMDKQKQFSQIAKEIEDNLKEISNPNYSGTGNLVGDTLSLFLRIEGSGQFSGGLSTAVGSAISQFKTTEIFWPPNQTTSTKSLWDLFLGTTQRPGSANYVSESDLAKALNETLSPLPPVEGGGSPPGPPNGNTDPGSAALQGILGGYDGIVTAVSSNSTQSVTTTQQGQSLIQALVKVMTGVTDKSQGMNTAVIAKTLQIPG